MAQSESETVLTEHHETDNLDPRTDAPARPGTPVHIAPVQLGNKIGRASCRERV